MPDRRDASIQLIPDGAAPSLLRAQREAEEVTRHRKSAPSDPQTGDWMAYCAAAPPLHPQALSIAMLDLTRRLGDLTWSNACAAALQVVAGTKPQFFSTQTQPLSLFERCGKTASHAEETASVSASCVPGSFPYSVAWFAYLLFLGVPLVGSDPMDFCPPSSASISLDASVRE